MPTPKPAAPYDRDPTKAAPHAFDRETGTPVGLDWLKSYERALRTYARHPETKFLGGDFVQSGTLRRRHVLPGTPTYIGKEADRWEEDEEFGAHDDSVQEYGAGDDARAEAIAVIKSALAVKGCTHKKLARAAKVSDTSVQRATEGTLIKFSSIMRLAQASERLRLTAEKSGVEREQWISLLREWVAAETVRFVAKRLGYPANNLRKVLEGARPASKGLLDAIRRCSNAPS